MLKNNIFGLGKIVVKANQNHTFWYKFIGMEIGVAFEQMGLRLSRGSKYDQTTILSERTGALG